jgi:hypothetical protein
MTLLKTNYQDTHLNYDPAYIKKLGHCFSAIMGVSVNTFLCKYLHGCLCKYHQKVRTLL